MNNSDGSVVRKLNQDTRVSKGSWKGDQAFVQSCEMKGRGQVDAMVYTLERSIPTVVLSLGVVGVVINPAKLRLDFLTLSLKGFLKTKKS